ncbi:tyrosine-type recombinase/integrase [Erysipelothrix anatis]|uniref:tyrosine-type recombinase/integrase n=1 Tax=Erysipelothrix anatis TaxID=2683713 RepID=UPI001357AC50|nr:site-specific integrase [Erysipelothrix anatis]
MAVYKTKSGKWKAKINYRDSSGTVRTKEKTLDKKSDASNYDREYRKTVNKDVSTGVSYRTIFEEYLTINSSKILPRSIQDKRSNAEKYWSHLFYKKYSSITKKDYLDVWVNISNSDKSYATKNKSIKYLKSISRYAYTYLDFDDNAKHLKTIKTNSDDIVEKTVWSQDQFNIFISFVDDPIYNALFRLYYDTGLTLSEALAIKKSDIDGNLISIDSMLDTQNNHKRLKNVYRKRKITLASKTMNQIEPLLNLEGDYLFGGVESLSSRTVPRKLKYYTDKANSFIEQMEAPYLLPRITIHGFRHSHATNLINNGVNIVSVSRRLGHSNIQTTLNVYTHLLDSKEETVIETIDNL